MARRCSAAIFLLAALGVAAASEEAAGGLFRPQVPRGLDLYLPVPEANELTPEKVALGRRLFFDPILSRDLSMSCSSCHQPGRAFTDDRLVAVGVFGRQGRRRVPKLLNRAWGRSFFWDGRAATLEEQVVRPIEDPNELDLPLEETVARLASHADYTALFTAAFGRQPNGDDLARALASYVRTILAGDAAVDRYLAGETDALSEEARAGLRFFRGKANCTACHLGPTFSDEQFHNTGVAWRAGEAADKGRAGVTGRAADRGVFKTPTLREVARTAPYMHDGSLATLEEVVEFYNRGGNANPYLDSEIRPLGLTAQEKQALVAFLHALSGTVQEGLTAAPID